jgi:hypothetical protein
MSGRIAKKAHRLGRLSISKLSRTLRNFLLMLSSLMPFVMVGELFDIPSTKWTRQPHPIASYTPSSPLRSSMATVSLFELRFTTTMEKKSTSTTHNPTEYKLPSHQLMLNARCFGRSESVIYTSISAQNTPTVVDDFVYQY